MSTEAKKTAAQRLIKCACGNPTCQMRAGISNGLLFVKSGEKKMQHTIFLTPQTILELMLLLIADLKRQNELLREGK